MRYDYARLVSGCSFFANVENTHILKEKGKSYESLF